MVYSCAQGLEERTMYLRQSFGTKIKMHNTILGLMIQLTPVSVVVGRTKCAQSSPPPSCSTKFLAVLPVIGYEHELAEATHQATTKAM